MKKTFRLIVTLMLVGGWALAASALHVVRGGDRPVIIPKDHVAVRDTYVNTANWSSDDVANHPALAKRLVATGNADALAHAFKAANHDDLVAQIEDAASRGPTTKPADLTAHVEKAVAKAEEVVEHVK